VFLYGKTGNMLPRTPPPAPNLGMTQHGTCGRQQYTRPYGTTQLALSDASTGGAAPCLDITGAAPAFTARKTDAYRYALARCGAHEHRTGNAHRRISRNDVVDPEFRAPTP